MSVTAFIPNSTVLLSNMVRRAVVDIDDRQIGTLADAIVRLPAEGYPHLTGLVVQVSTGTVFVPASELVALDSDRIQLQDAKLDLRPFERRNGEVLLSADILGHRLIDVDRAILVRAYDIALTRQDAGWVLTGLDVHKHRRLRKNAKHDRHKIRDWMSFEALIGHEASVLVRSTSGRLRHLKPAQIADLIQDASTKEQSDLLGHLHTNPELEADVFEELDDESQAQLLRSRSIEEVASVIARMRTDDAADLIMNLPQDRRLSVLDLLPEPQHANVLRLMKYNGATAGGLMGVEFLALHQDSTIQDALDALRVATVQQAEALTTIYCLDEDKRLIGSLSLVRALQLDPGSALRDVADHDPVHTTPGVDIIEVANLMADFNLLTLPVLGDHGHILGLVTVDDALEAAIPEDWRRREHASRATTILE